MIDSQEYSPIERSKFLFKGTYSPVARYALWLLISEVPLSIALYIHYVEFTIPYVEPFFSRAWIVLIVMPFVLILIFWRMSYMFEMNDNELYKSYIFRKKRVRYTNIEYTKVLFLNRVSAQQYVHFILDNKSRKEIVLLNPEDHASLLEYLQERGMP